jgi:hypothetical protein
MKTCHATKLVIVLMATALSSSCATVKTVGVNAKRVVKGQTVSKKDLKYALEHDEKELKRKAEQKEKIIEAELQVLRHKFEKVLAKLKTNVQQHWGRKETKVATRTVYVKYTHGYTSRPWSSHGRDAGRKRPAGQPEDRYRQRAADIERSGIGGPVHGQGRQTGSKQQALFIRAGA